MALSVLSFRAMYFDDQWSAAPGATPPSIEYTSTCPGNASAEVTVLVVGTEDLLGGDVYEVPGGHRVTVVGHTIHLPETAAKKGF